MCAYVAIAIGYSDHRAIGYSDHRAIATCVIRVN